MRATFHKFRSSPSAYEVGGWRSLPVVCELGRSPPSSLWSLGSEDERPSTIPSTLYYLTLMSHGLYD